tara:strand:- start:1165 stop:1470 length:306 start_codon:yes stop_codon:yes gene_type:complete
MTIELWTTLISNVGLPAAFVLAILLFLYRTFRAVVPYFREAFDKHIELVEQLKEALGKQHDETAKTNRALLHGADALDSLASKDKKEKVAVHTDAMRRELL